MIEVLSKMTFITTTTFMFLSIAAIVEYMGSCNEKQKLFRKDVCGVLVEIASFSVIAGAITTLLYYLIQVI
jgi:hypothetical protein